MINDILQDFREKSRKTIEAFINKLSTFRTGRASPSLVENMLVESYGTQMTLKSLASISIPEPKMILLQVWDRTNIPSIEKAIHTSDTAFCSYVAFAHHGGAPGAFFSGSNHDKARSFNGQHRAHVHSPGVLCDNHRP